MTEPTLNQTLQYAIDHHRVGRLQDAERLYRTILETQPNHPDANHNLGVLVVQVGKPAAALPLLKTALEANPKQGQYWLIYAETLLKAGHTEAARSVLAQGRQRGLQGEALEALAGRLDHLKNATLDQPTEQERAIALREAGRYNEAVLVLQSGPASTSQDASAYALLAQVLLLNKQDEQAWVALNIALSINPVLPIVQRNHARLLLKQQKPDEALQVAQAAYQSDDTDPENHLVLAAALGANNQKEQAFPLAETALQIRPNYAEAFATRALLKLRGNDHAGALADAEKALSIKPHLGQLWGMVGSLRYQFKNMSGAIDALEKALDYEPDHVGHLVSLGEFKRQTGAVEVAIPLLEKAVAIAPDNVGAWVNLGTALQQAQRIPEAKAAYAKALEIEPEQAQVASNLGALAKEEGNWEEVLRYFNQALAYQPNHVAIMTNRAVALNALDRYDEAEQAARQAIAVEPTHTDAHLALSGALTGQKKYEDARLVLDAATPPDTTDIKVIYPLALSYSNLFRSQKRWTEAEMWARRALALKPKAVKILRQLGVILGEQNRYEDAWVVLQEALESSPEDVDTLQAMAGHHAKQEHWLEAEMWARRALVVKPKAVKILRQLGVILGEQNRYEDAWVVLQEALESSPEDADTLQAMAGHHAKQEHWTEAEMWARRALVVKPNCVEALNALAGFLLAQDDPMTALHCIIRSLQIEESSGAKSLFVQCVMRLQFSHVSEHVRDAMARALCEPWGRPIDLVPAVTDMVKLDSHVGECVARAAGAWPQHLDAQILYGDAGVVAVAANALLCSLLVAAPVRDLDLERFLTIIRRVLLDAAAKATTSEAEDETILNFYSALARQCFINEYVFATGDDEVHKAGALRISLVAALEAKTPIPALWPVAVAAYFPLWSLPNAGHLLERSWPKPVTAVLVQQVREPEEELQERVAIPRLTDIEDEVSVLVQNQYEENPYPRWVKTGPAGRAVTIDETLRQLFPWAPFQSLSKCAAPDILIAGCGTGQHSIGTAQLFPGARVLAVDLSLTSLSYAKRKTRELGLTSIEYAQADLLKLGSLGRSFDVVESVGVLHHLADPWAGWRVLLSLLRAGGVMKLGFYSEAARQDIVRIRTFIAEHGYGSSAEEIRRCRQELMGLDENGDFGRTLKTGDFFSVSGCRDMLFHVQEHRMTLTGIEAFLRDNDLTFLGFEIKAEFLRAYKRRFPDDRAATNLGQWHAFENENPETFFGMYQFWIQKAAQ